MRRRFRTVTRGRRGSAQLGLLLAAAAAAGGMTLGSGVASKHASSGYDLAWLPDASRGQLVQVDPVLGRANVRLQVAAPGSTLSIQQGNGQLVVIDRKTGRITSIDLGTLLVGGSRSATPGDGVKVLLAGQRLYVADLPRGTVQAVDPATQANIGSPWSAGRPLVDIGVDGAHDVWALDNRRTLLNLRWDGSALSRVSARSVEGAGPGSVIVAHERGVTLVGSRGAIVRVGTGNDTRLDAPNVRGPLHGPERSPNGLVPVSDPGTSSVVIVGPSDAVVDDVSSYGCERPGTPTVFDGKVYVPCIGAHKVLVLDASGRQVGAAIPTPGGGDPQLTVSGGHLVIVVPGSGRATVVDRSGSTREFPTVAPGVGVQNPNTPPKDPPAPPKPEPVKHPHGGNDHNGDDHHGDDPNGNDPNGGGDGPGHGGTPSGAPSGAPSGGPSAPGVDGPDASAAARPDGSVLVSWSESNGGGATVVTDLTSNTEVATVPPGATSATVTVLAPGTTTSFAVRNAKVHATTNTVTTSTRPGDVTNLAVTPQGMKGGAVATLSVSWTAAPGNGARVSYSVSTGNGSIKTTSAVTTSIQVPCAATGCSGTVTVTSRNWAGAGTPASAPYSVAGTTPAPAPPTTAPPAQPTPEPQPTTQAPPAPVQIAMPASGEQLITTTADAGSDTGGQYAVAHLNVNAPADWAAFGAAGGTCNLFADGVDEGAIPCNVSAYTRDFGYDASGTHEYWVTASDSGRTVESVHATQTVTYRQTCLNSAGERSLTGVNGNGALQRPIDCGQDPPTCPNCQIPFKQGTPLSGGGADALAPRIAAGVGRAR